MTFIQGFQGWTPYRSDFCLAPHRLLVAVECVVGDLPAETFGLLDTAAEWCVLPTGLAAALEIRNPGDCEVRLDSRVGLLRGHLERIPVRFPAAEGEPLTIEATWFISPEWTGPLVLGWKGCLERFRFAVLPDEERFYFGAL